jgi:uncharacterized protein (TIGR03083 family)
MPTTTTTAHDYPALVRDELADMRSLLRGLPPDAWDAPSLCEGWRVRDVVGHACTGYTYTIPKVVFEVARHGFSLQKAADRVAIEFADDHSPAELLEVLDEATSLEKPKGFVKTVAWRDRLADHMIHELDIRRPFGMAREFPAERMRAALDALPKIGGGLGSKKRVKGLKLVATDLDHTVDDGPEVRGPAEAILLAASGRTVALPELTGDGVAVLRERIGA